VQLLRRTGRLPEARAAAEEALRRLPEAPEVLLEATELYHDLRERDRAQELAEQLLRKWPELVPGLVVAARVRYMRKEPAEAAALFRRVLEQRGEDPWYRTWYAASLAESGDRPAARRELDAVLARHPRHREALVIRGRLRAREDPAGAARDFRAALELDPTDERTRAALEALPASR
jgi:tetratricopeptide (TPR) repeat protein